MSAVTFQDLPRKRVDHVEDVPPTIISKNLPPRHGPLWQRLRRAFPAESTFR